MTAAAVAPLLAAPSASADCQATIRVPNLSITSSSVYDVKGVLADACGAISAIWDMDYGSQNHGSWIFSGSPIDYSYFYPGLDPVGQYQAVGTDAYDGSFNSVPQATAYFQIKYGSAAYVRAARSGHYVYVRADVKRFNPNLNYGLGDWQASAGRRVDIYAHYSGAWHWAGHAYTAGNGWTSAVKIYAPTGRYFRDSVTQTGGTWGAWSSSVYS